MKEFALNLKKAREGKKLNQTQLAELAGVSQQSVSVYERGLGYPELLIYFKLCEVLGEELDPFHKFKDSDETITPVNEPVDPLSDMLITKWRNMTERQKLQLLLEAEKIMTGEAAPETQPGEPKQIKARPGFHGTQNKLRGIPLMILQQAIGE